MSAVLELGVAVIDSAVAGLGGCPYARGAKGNVATENVLYMLRDMGVETAVGLDAVVEVAWWISEALGRRPNSRVALALGAERQLRRAGGRTGRRCGHARRGRTRAAGGDGLTLFAISLYRTGIVSLDAVHARPRGAHLGSADPAQLPVVAGAGAARPRGRRGQLLGASQVPFCTRYRQLAPIAIKVPGVSIRAAATSVAPDWAR